MTRKIWMLENRNLYSKACRTTARNFSWVFGDLEAFKKKSEKSVSQEFLDSISFTGLEIEPWEVHVLAYFGFFASLFLMLLLDLFLFILGPYEKTDLLVAAFSTAIIPIAVMFYLSEYPKIQARFMKIHSLGDIPEVLSYIVMSMKLVPNLERAIVFAAENSLRPLAKDLRKLLWEIHLRVYSGMDDALIGFANQWGKHSEYFKRALHLVKSSTSEPDEAQRLMTLNRSLDIVLDGTKTAMEGFAARLRTPTYILYSIFILIPLALVALLPAVGIVGIRIDTFTLIFIYNVLLPIATFFYSEYILLQRPAAFPPPRIKDDHPDLSGIRSIRRISLILAIGIGGVVGLSGHLLLYFGNPFGLISQGAMTGLVPATFPIIWGITAMISVYSLGTSYPYKRIRDSIKEIENEFADALFILGRRISEGKSPEEAFFHASETKRGSKIGEAFGDTWKNLIAFQTDLNRAIFSENYGSFRNIYSERVRTTMKLFIESVHKSHEAAGVAIVKLADHLKELQSVEANTKQSLYDVTSTMRSTATLFAPLIGGVTLALSEVIEKILLNIAREASSLSEEIKVPSIMREMGTDIVQSFSPEVFLLSIGLYMILLVVILVRFAGGIDYGGDKPKFLSELGNALPLSMLVFTISTIVSRVIFGSLV